MLGPYFKISDLTVRLPKDFSNSIGDDNPDSVTNFRDLCEEWVHHYHMFTTSQGILSTLTKIGILVLLHTVFFHKMIAKNKKLFIPLKPYYDDIKQIVKCFEKGSKLHKGTAGDVYLAAIMNYVDVLEGAIDTDLINTTADDIKNTGIFLTKKTIVENKIEAEIPIIAIQDSQGTWKEVPFGLHAIFEGYARMTSEIMALIKSKSDDQKQAIVRDYLLMKQQKQNLPHFLTFCYAQTQAREIEFYDRFIACMVASYLSLMVSDFVIEGKVPLLFSEDVPNQDNIYIILREFSDSIPPGLTFLSTFESATEILASNKKIQKLAQEKNPQIYLELTNMVCDDLKMDRPEATIKKLKDFLANLRNVMAKRYSFLLETFIDLALNDIEFASQDLESHIHGLFVTKLMNRPSKDTSVITIEGEKFIGNISEERLRLILHVSNLEQIFSKDRVLCLAKTMHAQNPNCKNSEDCRRNFFTPSEKCEKEFLNFFKLYVGDYRKIQPPSH
jgi:hypothetical protein